MPAAGIAVGTQTLVEGLSATAHDQPRATVHEAPASITVHEPTEPASVGAGLESTTAEGPNVGDGRDTVHEDTLPAAAVAGETPSVPQSSVASVQSVRPRGRRRRVAAGLVAAVVVLGGGVTAFALNRGGSDAQVKGRTETRVVPRPTVDNTPPTIRITEPAPDFQTIYPAQTVKGVIEPATDAEGGTVTLVTLNGIAVPSAPRATIDPSGAWHLEVQLQEGPNRLGFVAEDSLHNKSEPEEITIVKGTFPAPTTPPTQPPRRSSGKGGTTPTSGPSITTQPITSSTSTADVPTGNGNAQLAQSCHDADFAACDTLYQVSDPNTESAYETYGADCGGRKLLGLLVGGYGDCVRFFALANSCYYGDFGACDNLYRWTSFGTGFERYGETCANRVGNVFNATHEPYCVAWHNQGFF